MFKFQLAGENFPFCYVLTEPQKHQHESERNVFPLCSHRHVRQEVVKQIQPIVLCSSLYICVCVPLRKSYVSRTLRLWSLEPNRVVFVLELKQTSLKFCAKLNQSAVDHVHQDEMCRLWSFERLPETLKGRLSELVSDTPGLVVRQDGLSVSAGDTVEHLVHLDKTSMLRDKTSECNDPAGVRALQQKPINHSHWKLTVRQSIMRSGMILLQSSNRLTGNSQLLFFCILCSDSFYLKCLHY